MTIDEQIAHMEATAEADINALMHKDRLTYYANLKEYQRAKLQRTGAANSDELPPVIEIKIVK
jgi:hypothetical protein